MLMSNFAKLLLILKISYKDIIIVHIAKMPRGPYKYDLELYFASIVMRRKKSQLLISGVQKLTLRRRKYNI